MALSLSKSTWTTRLYGSDHRGSSATHVPAAPGRGRRLNLMRQQDLVDSADLLAVLSAIGHPVQDAFDPHRFLDAFSRHLEGLISHDSVMIAYQEDEGRISTVFAEQRRQGPYLHDGRYTTSFDPGGRYVPDEWGL